jgi:hypothetical protein
MPVTFPSHTLHNHRPHDALLSDILQSTSARDRADSAIQAHAGKRFVDAREEYVNRSMLVVHVQSGDTGNSSDGDDGAGADGCVAPPSPSKIKLELPTDFTMGGWDPLRQVQLGFAAAALNPSEGATGTASPASSPPRTGDGGSATVNGDAASRGGSAVTLSAAISGEFSPLSPPQSPSVAASGFSPLQLELPAGASAAAKAAFRRVQCSSLSSDQASLATNHCLCHSVRLLKRPFGGYGACFPTEVYNR